MCMHRRCWFSFLAIFILFHSQVHAATAPAYNGKMNQAVGGLIQYKASKWGFAANDPRVPATLSAVGGAVTTIAIGVGTGAVATVGWPALLMAAGITGLVSGAVSLGEDSFYKWFFNSDGTITTQGGAVVVTDPNGTYIPTNSAAASGCTTVNNITDLCVRTGQKAHNFSACLPAGGLNPTLSCKTDTSLTFTQAMQKAGYSAPTTTTSGDITNAPVSTAIANVPNSELSKPISDQYLAASANAAWKAMSSSNALPWSAADPITPADVAAWKAANPSAVPTVSDALAPISSTNTSTVPITDPSISPSTGPATTPSTGTTSVDLGANPNIGAPTLENTPTAQQILNPILTIMPELRNFQVPSHSGVCPKPSFAVWDKTYSLDSHCGLIESNRNIIETAMLLVWSIIGIFIVLKA